MKLFKETAFMEPLLKDVPLKPSNFYPRNGFYKKHRFDRYQMIVVISYEHKLRGHHPSYNTV